MAWRKHFKTASFGGSISPISGNNDSTANVGIKNYQSHLPDVYVGHPNRIERYNQYEQMDADSEINAALDILAEFSTQTNIENGTAFDISFNEKPSDNEIKIIKEQLQQWCKLNDFDKRIFKIFRNTIKYGDQIFVRDPETFKLLWCEMSKVTKVIVNESNGKEPEQYVLKELNPNLTNLTVTAVTTSDTYMNHPQIGGPVGSYTPTAAGQAGGSRFSNAKNESVINAEHIVHFSLTEGLDIAWPFGTSVLETVFKVFKQKELLEDAIIIYRIQRAPERRVFKIDVGNMPAHMAMAFVERVKNEVHQRRMPTQSGGGQNMMDATYNPICLDLSTRVPLLDGRTLSLHELINEYNGGKENWAYSCDPVTGEVKPGVISWAGVTKKDAKVLKLTLDNGNTLICTPEHKIPVLGKGFVEAKDLKTTDSLIAWNTQEKPLSSSSKDRTYTQVYNHALNKWEFTHRLVGEFFRKQNKHREFTYLTEYVGAVKNVIHHKNYDRYNNDPRNLLYMNKQDHLMYHSLLKAEYWENISTDEKLRVTTKISETVKKNWLALTEEQREIAREKVREAQKLSVIATLARSADPVRAAEYKENARKNRAKTFAEKPVVLAQVKKNCEKRIKFQNQELNLTRDMLSRVAEITKSEKNKVKAITLCDNDLELLNLVKQENATNPNTGNPQSKIDFTKWGYSKMKKLLAKFGFVGWKDFTSKVDSYNHKIVSIEYLEETMDVGTLTIDQKERWHAHHTFATECGIFVKNSMNEDFFFPQMEGGRGSSVEILAGGSNLGEITDLRFFTNKLFRGLRIPSSYLPTQTEEASNTFSDGKSATAMIQDWRFNQYCKRLQSFIAAAMDKEFKLFMRFRGINIDSSVFDLKFNEPQNFTSYRQIDLDTARISTYTQLEAFPYFSKRWLMERYLGMSEEEMQENEEMWAEEHAETEIAEPEDASLRSVGVSAGGIGADLENMAPAPGEEAAGGMGVEGAPLGAGAEAGGGAPAGGAPGVM